MEDFETALQTCKATRHRTIKAMGTFLMSLTHLMGIEDRDRFTSSPPNVAPTTKQKDNPYNRYDNDPPVIFESQEVMAS